jgi:hypothetical protein
VSVKGTHREAWAGCCEHFSSATVTWGQPEKESGREGGSLHTHSTGVYVQSSFHSIHHGSLSLSLRLSRYTSPSPHLLPLHSLSSPSHGPLPLLLLPRLPLYTAYALPTSGTQASDPSTPLHYPLCGISSCVIIRRG